MNERKYLPNIPLLPEEREAAEKSGKPKLPGAPSEAHESILLAIEEGLPLLDKVGKDLKAYTSISQAEKQKTFRQNKFRSFLDAPEELEAYFDTLRILGENWEGRQEETQSYTEGLLGGIEKSVNIGTLSPEALKGWLTLMTKSEVYRPVAERVIKTVAEKAQSPQATVSFMYNLAEAFYLIDDIEVLKMGLDIITASAPFLENRLALINNFQKALFTVNDDALLRKAFEVDMVLDYFAREHSVDSYQKMKEGQKENLRQRDYLQFLKSMSEIDPIKLKKLGKFFNKFAGGGLSSVSPEEAESWPFTLVLEGGKLRDLYNEKLAQDSDGKHLNIHLPDMAMSMLTTPEKARVDILGCLVETNTGEELRDSKYLKTLFYISPELSPSQKEALSNDVVGLRQEINRDQKHAISSRGDKMLVVDAEVRDNLSLKSITFKVEEHKPSITVWVEVGNYKFVVLVDKNFEMKDVTGKNLPISLGQRAFIEHLVLSHLKELMCTERIKSGQEDDESPHVERQEEFRRRRAHLRTLPPNHGYTPEALFEGLAHPRRYDLARINAELGRTRETGQETFVKELSRSLPGDKPLESKAPHATDRINEILTHAA